MFANDNQEFYDTQSLNSIYRQLSISENDDFDEMNDNDYLINLIGKLFKKEFLLIENKILENDVNLINKSFVQLVVTCKKDKYTKSGFIFICYCDYFNLNYHKVYNHLHEKLKDIIKKSFVNLIGKKEYILKKQKFGDFQDYYQPTILELFADKIKKEDSEKLKQNIDNEDDEYFTDEEIENQIKLESQIT